MLAAVLWLATLGVLAVIVARTMSWDEQPHVADVSAFAVAAAVSGAVVIRWARNSAASGTTRPDQIAAAKDTLVDLVRKQWRAESVIRSLEPDPIPVMWRLTEDSGLLHHRHLIGEGALEGAGNAVSRLADGFKKLRRRRLVITGDAGAGKTTLAIQLLLELTGPGRDPADPVPVLLSPSGWDTTKDTTLHSWLARSLERDYPALRATDFGADMARELVMGGHVLPILDGMDELPRLGRAEIVRMLERSLDATEAFILTSRTEELRQAVEDAGPFPSVAVIAPAPLTPAAAEGYLRTCLPPAPGPVWGKVLSGLRTGRLGALAQLTATPLGLWLLRAVYVTSRADPAPLTGKLGHDPEALRSHLWDGLIPVLLAARQHGGSPAGRPGVRAREPRRAWDAVEMRRYLSHLARVLSAHGTRDLAWWRLGEQALSGDERRRSARSTWVIVGVLIGVVAGLAGRLPVLVTVPVGFAAGFGVLTAVLGGFTGTPGRVSIQLRGRLTDLGRQITVVLLLRTVFAAGGVFGAALVAEAEPGLALEAGIWAGLALGPGLVLIAWMQQPTPVTAATTPYHAWRASRTLTILCAVVPGVAAGLAAGLVGGLAHGPWFGIRLGLLSGVFIGLGVGLATLRHSAWPAYELTARHLAGLGECPKHLMGFLDDAHRLGLLRVVGPVYQFRHADLQDHLAGRTVPER